MLQQYLTQYKDIFQYIYSHIFPEIYTTSEKRGINLKNNFHILFKAYRDKILVQQELTAKDPSNQNQKGKRANSIKCDIKPIMTNLAIAKRNDLLNDAKKDKN